MSEYRDLFGNLINLTQERWRHIIIRHPEVVPYRNRIGTVLKDPDLVKKSRGDKDVYLYYRYYQDILAGKYVLVVVKKGPRPFVLTTYLTDYIKKGDVVWEKN